MTNRVADDFAAIRKRLDELTQEGLKQLQSDSGDEHTIAVQPSTGKRYKWIDGRWTEEEYTLTGSGPIDHNPSPYWIIPQASQTWQQSAQQYYDWLDQHKLTYEEWAKQGHTLLDFMI